MAVLIVAGAACAGDDDNQPSASDAGASNASAVSNVVVTRKDIVSDSSGAMATDKTLVNAWGLAFNPIGAAWVSSAEEGVSEVYDAKGKAVIPAVTIPAPAGSTSKSAPTGQVFNANAAAFKGDSFIFATEDGTIAGWQPSAGKRALMRVDNSSAGAIYKGITIADSNGRERLFAADFHGAKIDVFDSSYKPIKTSEDFSDAKIPSGFAPFNVQELNGMLVVTLTNHGCTAAEMTRTVLRWKLAVLLDPKPRYPVGAVKDPSEFGNIVKQGESYNLAESLSLSGGDVESIRRGETHLWVYGYVAYRDFQCVQD